MLLVVGSTGEKPPAGGGAGVVAFCFPSVRLCAGGSALRTPIAGSRVNTPSRRRPDCAGLDGTPASTIDRDKLLAHLERTAARVNKPKL